MDSTSETVAGQGQWDDIGTAEGKENLPTTKSVSRKTILEYCGQDKDIPRQTESLASKPAYVT